jgi:ubiquinone biosynthesis protein
MPLKHLKRFLEIYSSFAKHRCYFMLEKTPYHRPARILGKIIAPKAAPNSYIMSNGQRLTASLQNLGPAFIKLGQSLSVRPDIVGDEIADELRNLQDRLPPFPTQVAKDIIEKELGMKVSEIFRTFDEQPVAAASISQVHFARSMNGEELAVKILRPNIEARFFKDINLLFWIANIVNKRFPRYRRLKLKEAVDIVAETSRIEMDLMFEAAAANELEENFKGDDDIRIPKIYWQNSSPKVLVLERFTGIRIDEIKKLTDAGHNVDDILRKSANIFLKQTLRDGYFHADMHPGNVLVNKDGKICVFDFGIMGRIDRKTRIFMAEMLLAFLNRDYKKVSDIHFEAGYIPANQSRDLFAQACRAIGEPIFDLPQNQISIARLLQQLFRITEQFEMETQPQLLLLQKTMMMAEGIARKLNPQINFWELTRELIEDWGRDNLGPKARLEEAADIAKQTFYNFAEAVKNLNKVITPEGLVLANQSKYIFGGKNSFWKGFISAILLSIIAILLIINFIPK